MKYELVSFEEENGKVSKHSFCDEVSGNFLLAKVLVFIKAYKSWLVVMLTWLFFLERAFVDSLATLLCG